MFNLEVEYGGARLRLEFGQAPAARLVINGLVREQVEQATGGGDTANLRLSSTVQTDYEWHEFIEAVVRYEQDTIYARIMANGQALTNREFDRGITP